MIEITMRPSFEGANIRSWIGFKHFEYMMCDAVSELLSRQGFGQRDLVLSGVRANVVGSRSALTHVIECGDEVGIALHDARRVEEGLVALDAEIFNKRAGQRSLKGTYLVAVEDIAEEGLVGDLTAAAVLESFPEGVLKGSKTPRPGRFAADKGLFDTSFFVEWTVPYYYCEASRFLSYRGHIRSLESVVDDYLADVGLLIPDLLADRAMIPVVSRYSIRVHADVPMGARVVTHFHVDDVLGGAVFNASFATIFTDVAGRRVVAANGVIQHGYAISRGEGAGTMATMPPGIIACLQREVTDAVAN